MPGSIVKILKEAVGQTTHTEAAKASGMRQGKSVVGHVLTGYRDSIPIALADWALNQTVFSGEVRERLAALLLEAGLNERQRRAMLATFDELQDANRAASASQHQTPSSTHSGSDKTSGRPLSKVAPSAPSAGTSRESEGRGVTLPPDEANVQRALPPSFGGSYGIPEDATEAPRPSPADTADEDEANDQATPAPAKESFGRDAPSGSDQKT